MTVRSALFIAAMIALAAPVSGQNHTQPGPGQKCSVGNREARKPDPPHVALEKAQNDSLKAVVASILADRLAGKGYLVLHVDQFTGRRSFEAVDLDLGQGLLDSLAVPLAIHANRSGRSVVVSIPTQRPSDSDSVGVQFEACPPVVRNTPVISRYINHQVRELGSHPGLGGAKLETRLLVYVSDRGKPLTTAIRQSSGNPAYDRIAIAGAMKGEFYPALMNGVPTPVWVSLPIQAR